MGRGGVIARGLASFAIEISILMKEYGLKIACVDLDDPTMVNMTRKLTENLTPTKNMA